MRGDQFQTVDSGPPVETRVLGSRFIGQVFKIKTREDADLPLADLRKLHPSASHHVSAGRTLPGPQMSAWSDDDGEPSGTSGPPILARIEGERLYGTFIVVVRYFGGTKLGKGGLIRAYGESATAALQAAGQSTVTLTHRISVCVDYAQLGVLERFLSQQSKAMGIQRAMRNYGDTLEFEIVVRQAKLDLLKNALTEALAGKLSIKE